MGYHSFRPRPELSAWLASVWVQEAPAVEAPPTTVLPTGHAELIVRFGDPFVHVEDAGTVTLPPVTALGQRTRPIRAAATGTTGLVIARLQPWASDVLFGAETAAFGDRMLDLAALAGSARVASLVDQVASAARPEDRARAVECFVARLARRTPDARVGTAARRLTETGGRASTERLARELGLSGRQLRRRFAEAVGVGPKRFARLMRGQEALRLLRRGEPWATVALHCGYFDQAHLARELKAFTGSTPAALRKPGRDTPLMRSFNRAGPSPFFSTVYL